MLFRKIETHKMCLILKCAMTNVFREIETRCVPIDAHHYFPVAAILDIYKLVCVHLCNVFDW